jgi:S-adenosylhomocysteine hydrolase
MFPKYSVLSYLSSKFSLKYNFSNVHIVSVQHLLESTGSLFESIIQTGILPSNIFLTGKLYSTHLETKNKLKKLGINVIESTIPEKLGFYSESLEKDICEMWKLVSLKLKPGDNIIKNYQVYGIEQTTSGIRMQSAFGKFPVIHLAASAAKVIIEPPIVSEAVNIKIGKTIEELQPQKVGIVGYGYIGKAVVNEFKEKYSIYVYDNVKALNGIAHTDITYTRSLQELYEVCDVIVGVTGQDISNLNWLKTSNGNKTLISISSGDIEFNKLLRACEPYMLMDLKNPLQDIMLRTENGYSLKILRGGMVANFTGTPDSSPGNIIQVTRGLLFSGVMQAIRDNELLQGLSGPIMLDPNLQLEVVNTWFTDQPQRQDGYSSEIKNGFKDIEWIKTFSSGLFLTDFSKTV